MKNDTLLERAVLPTQVKIPGMNQCLKEPSSSIDCKGSESVIPLQEKSRAVMVESVVTNGKVMLLQIALGLG